MDITPTDRLMPRDVKIKIIKLRMEEASQTQVAHKLAKLSHARKLAEERELARAEASEVRPMPMTIWLRTVLIDETCMSSGLSKDARNSLEELRPRRRRWYRE